MKSRTLACGALAGLAVLAPISAAGAKPASAAPHTGVVVDYRAASRSATVALPGGDLIAVHTSRRVRPGARVSVAALTPLANGTYAGALRVRGHARTVRVRGTVSAHLGRRAIAVSARGTTFVVRLGAAKAAAGTNRSDELQTAPAVGTTISTVVTIGGAGRLECNTISELAAPVVGDVIDIEGRIGAVDEGTRTLTVSVEDDGLGAEFTVLVPDTIDLTQYVVGDELEASVLVNADGTFTLQGSSLNGDQQEADDTSDDQGDQPAEDQIGSQRPDPSGAAGEDAPEADHAGQDLPASGTLG